MSKKKCRYCENDNAYRFAVFKKQDSLFKNPTADVEICGNELHLDIYCGTPNCTDYVSLYTGAMKVNYCPICGRKLESEARI